MSGGGLQSCNREQTEGAFMLGTVTMWRMGAVLTCSGYIVFVTAKPTPKILANFIQHTEERAFNGHGQ